MFPRRKINLPHEGKIEPFRIAGGVWFVGTYQASAHLIDTGDGLIFIDPGYHNTLYLVIRSIYEAGFRPEQIRYIVNTHWHWDHTEATAELAALSGAETIIGRRDAENAARYFTPDRLVGDGDTLTLGNTTLTFYETPGHTAGTISFFFDLVEDGRTLRAGMFGGAGANTLAQGKFDYPDCREDYRASVRRLAKEHVDVFLGNHTWNNNTEEHARILRETGENRFLDDTLWGKFLAFCEARLDKTIARDI